MGRGGRQDLGWGLQKFFFMGVAEVYAHDLAGGLAALICGWNRGYI